MVGPCSNIEEQLSLPLLGGLRVMHMQASESHFSPLSYRFSPNALLNPVREF